MDIKKIILKAVADKKRIEAALKAPGSVRIDDIKFVNAVPLPAAGK